MTLSDQTRDLPDDNSDYATLMDSLDIANCLRLFDRKWNDLFKRKLSIDYRTWAKELAQSNVKPTLKDAVAGDITAAMPYRAMTNIIEFIKMLDMVVPGFAANETLLYSPELKFYSNKVKMDENLDTNIQGLHCLGDSSGWTRGLMMASVMGVLMGRKLAEKEGC